MSGLQRLARKIPFGISIAMLTQESSAYLFMDPMFGRESNEWKNERNNNMRERKSSLKMSTLNANKSLREFYGTIGMKKKTFGNNFSHSFLKASFLFNSTAAVAHRLVNKN